MALPALSRISAPFTASAAGALLLAGLAPAAVAQPTQAEGYDSLLSCAAFFSAIGGIAGADTKDGKDATDLATNFMTGALLIAPAGKEAAAEAELEKQAEMFAEAMLDEKSASSADLDKMLESCGALGETYLAEILATAK